MSDVIEEVLRKAKEKRARGETQQQPSARFGTFPQMGSALEKLKQDAVASGAMQKKLDSPTSYRQAKESGPPRMRAMLVETGRIKKPDDDPLWSHPYNNPFAPVEEPRRKK